MLYFKQQKRLYFFFYKYNCLMSDSNTDYFNQNVSEKQITGK